MQYQLYERYRGDNQWRSCGLFPNTKEARKYAKEHCNPYSSTRIATYNSEKRKDALEVRHLLEEKQGEIEIDFD